ncbi:DUF5667 domain-containing protein [Nocardioides sp. J54]|uniref:DUF5667 domain-containing protein n=1 Tax=Nocardioides sp. J54 TaxID=935866 RepID=UPI0018DD1724|nr:DUF5667 domain-containing protein [Nocardioides sp. J54]
MRGNGWSRGSAEEFDALVSGRAADSEAHAELLDLVAALRAVPPVEARPEFVSSLRSQLVAAAERAPVEAEEKLAARLTPRQRRGSRERRLAAVVGGFAVVSATGSMAMASQSALPGDVLYPVKRAIENAETNLQSKPASKAGSLISHAEARLAEVQELTAKSADAEVIASTLEDFTAQAQQASELTLEDYQATGKGEGIADLRAFAADSMDVLGALGPVVPEEVRAPLITATQTVRQVDAAAWEACPTCADGGITRLPDLAAIEEVKALLDVPVIDQADVTAPAKVKPTKKPDPGTKPTDGTAPADAPTTEGPLAPVTKKVGEVVDDITKGVGGIGGGGTGGGGSTPDPSQSAEPGVVGTLLDGVGGLLGGLLK